MEHCVLFRVKETLRKRVKRGCIEIEPMMVLEDEDARIQAGQVGNKGSVRIEKVLGQAKYSRYERPGPSKGR
jgi:hypothetical protein